MKALAYDPGHEHTAVCDEIDEYFRKKFRKIDFVDAKNILLNMGDDLNQDQEVHSQKIQGLDGKFWVWETLEEATRPHIYEIAKEEIIQYNTAWLAQMKGSEELHDLMLERISYFFADINMKQSFHTVLKPSHDSHH